MCVSFALFGECEDWHRVQFQPNVHVRLRVRGILSRSSSSFPGCDCQQGQGASTLGPSARCHFRTTQRFLQTIPSAPATTRSLGLEAATPNAQLRHGRVSGYLAKHIPSTSTFAFRPFLLSRLLEAVSRGACPDFWGHEQVEISAVSIVSDLCSVSCRGSSGNVFCLSLLLLGLSIVRRSFGSAPFTLVQFVGLTVIAVCLLEELPKRGSRELTEQK